MLQFNVGRVLKAKGIEKPASYLKSQGFSSATTTRILHESSVGFSLQMVERICLVLNCTPNDLLEWVPSKNTTNPASHALMELKRADALGSVSQLLNNASISQLEKMEAIIKKELGL